MGGTLTKTEGVKFDKDEPKSLVGELGSSHSSNTKGQEAGNPQHHFRRILG